MQHIVALCGGVGGAKLADGLQQILAPDALSVIVNTGDDFEHRGLPICPDLDTVLYTLAGVANAEQGWGRADETWRVQAQWRELELDTWFQLGDRDIALHLYRRELQSQGMTLTAITRELARRFGVGAELLPMCDQPAPTTVLTELGELPFQEYFVKHRCAPAVRGFRYGGERSATLSDEVRAVRLAGHRAVSVESLLEHRADSGGPGAARSPGAGRGARDRRVAADRGSGRQGSRFENHERARAAGVSSGNRPPLPRFFGPHAGR